MSIIRVELLILKNNSINHSIIKSQAICWTQYLNIYSSNLISMVLFITNPLTCTQQNIYSRNKVKYITKIYTIKKYKEQLIKKWFLSCICFVFNRWSVKKTRVFILYLFFN
jgi:hypothetical protein